MQIASRHANLSGHFLGRSSQLVHSSGVVQGVVRVTRRRRSAPDESPAIFAVHLHPGWLRWSLKHEQPLPLQWAFFAQRQRPPRHRPGRCTHHGPLPRLPAVDVHRRQLDSGVSLGFDGDRAGAIARAELGHEPPDLQLVKVQIRLTSIDVFCAP